MNDPVSSLMTAMKIESQNRVNQLSNAGGLIGWETLQGGAVYPTYSHTAADLFERADPFEQTDTARDTIRKKIAAGFTGTAIAGLSQRRLSRMRGVAAGLSRRRAICERDADAMTVVASARYATATRGFNT